MACTILLLYGFMSFSDALELMIIWYIVSTILFEIVIFRVELFHLPSRFYFENDYLIYFPRYDKYADSQLKTSKKIPYKNIFGIWYKNTKYSKTIKISLIRPKDTKIILAAPKFENCEADWNSIIERISKRLS